MPSQTATYERILKTISNQRVTTTAPSGPDEEAPGIPGGDHPILDRVDAVEKVWFSMFTPQRGDEMPEILTTAERAEAIRVIHDLRERYPKVAMPKRLVDHFNSPPSSPSDCIFSQVTETISADFQTSITPCQFGGDPDCSQCGCMASMALAAVGAYKVGGLIPAGALFRGSVKIGAMRRAMRDQPAVNENRCGYSVGPTCAAAGDFYRCWPSTDRQIATDRFRQEVGDLAVARKRFSMSGLRVLPHGVLFSLPSQHTAVPAKVAQQGLALHPTTTDSCSAPGGIERRESSRRCSRISAMASQRLSRQASRDLPWPLAPGALRRSRRCTRGRPIQRSRELVPHVTNLRQFGSNVSSEKVARQMRSYEVSASSLYAE